MSATACLRLLDYGAIKEWERVGRYLLQWRIDAKDLQFSSEAGRLRRCGLGKFFLFLGFFYFLGIFETQPEIEVGKCRSSQSSLLCIKRITLVEPLEYCNSVIDVIKVTRSRIR